MQTGWEGEWKVFWQAQNQTYVEGMLTVEVAGTDFTAIAVLEGVNYTFTGRIIRDVKPPSETGLPQPEPVDLSGTTWVQAIWRKQGQCFRFCVHGRAWYHPTPALSPLFCDHC
jgi:hypothetical protein